MYRPPDVVLEKADLERCLAALPAAEQQLVTDAALCITVGLWKAGAATGLEILAAVGRLLNDDH